LVRLSFLPEIMISSEIESIIIKAAEKSLLSEGCLDSEVSIMIVDDSEIQRLNRLYRNVNEATDVLAFSMKEGLDTYLSDRILGDIVVSISTAERQAIRYGHSVGAEISLLISHGVLHLLGYDHEPESEIMIQKQKAILLTLGYDINVETY